MKPEDSGEYKVTVTNSNGSTDVTTSINVTDPVATPDVTFDFIQKLENLSIKDGMSRHLLEQYHTYNTFRYGKCCLVNENHERCFLGQVVQRPRRTS